MTTPATLLPATIQPTVGPTLITRVTRLYNGTAIDCLLELLQNSRRAGATSIDIDLVEEDGVRTLVLRDDGSGIDDPLNLLTLGQSGWKEEIAASEDPAGMGVFSLAGRDVTVRSYSRSAGRGWQVTIPADGWEGQIPLAIGASDIAAGTQISVTLPDAWAEVRPSARSVSSKAMPGMITCRALRPSTSPSSMTTAH